jgi:uncharacterized protein (DUF2236 family)
MLRARLEAAARELMTPDDARVDFTMPTGEPALVPPDSVSWQVFKNPVTLFVGGVAAVILELAEPRVRAGVWEHSSFRHDPVGRLQRTGLAAMVTVYGARSVAEAMIDGINRRHGAIHGRTEDGEPYRADDPELLTWVQATAAFGFLQAYATYARPVGGADRDAYYAEGMAAARLYGAVSAPSSEAELQSLFATMRPRLMPSETLVEFLGLMRAAPLLPPTLRWMQRLLVRAAIDIVPGWARERLGLRRDGLRPWERPLASAAGGGADRLVLRSSPVVQSCRRLGLPDDYLFRGNSSANAFRTSA